MRPKFLLAFAPVLAVAAFAVAPVAAQAAPCFQNSAKGACITASEGLVGELTGGKSKLTSAGGLTVESESFTIEGKAETGGKSKITKAVFDGNSINLPAPCKATPELLKTWTDQLSGSESAGYKDTITVPTEGGAIVISGCTGAYEPYNGTHYYSGEVTGTWTNDSPSTLAFSKAKGLLLGGEATEFTATFDVTRANGSNIYVSES
ncbi:MAG TPA: hypothetical protein VIJ66_06530 [Solirubrobacteraceae bacterium]